MRFFQSFTFLLAGLLSCHNNSPQQQPSQDFVPQALFSDRISQGTLQNNDITEASGLAASRTYTGGLWTHNDSGGESTVFLVGTKGEDIAKFTLEGVANIDWEEIDVCPFQNIPYIYVSDIGDNSKNRSHCTIYRFAEPKITNTIPTTGIIKQIDKIRFQYNDGSRDAETVMIDPTTQDIYVVSKREEKNRLYVIKYPYSLTDINIAQYVTAFPFILSTAGDISPSGNEVLIKNYANIFYWKRQNNESLVETLKRKPTALPYTLEPQGEAIAWKLDETGYYTVSEKQDDKPVNLYFYKRN
ncbi:MAG: hypothetical protein ACOVQA_10090 [Thermoflexibacteraceae bacterium]|jgi:hypothetical protein